MPFWFGMWLTSVVTGSRGGISPSGAIVDIGGASVTDIGASIIVVSV